MDKNLSFYEQNKTKLVEQYDSVSFESVHQDWLEFIPSHGSVLDIGAGSGRDARYLSELGLSVYAAEPAQKLLDAAMANSVNHDIKWFNDSLPNLNEAKRQDTQFDLILLSAVWMHLSPAERELSMQSMAALLNKHGKLVITLRFGDFSDERTAYLLSADEVAELAERSGLSMFLKTPISSDQLGRNEVVWQTVVVGK